jgi:hypothetical protein
MFPASSKIWLINISLAAAVVFLGIMSYEVWTKSDDMIPEARAAKNSVTSPPPARVAERVIPPESTYGIVVEKNLFFANRSEIFPKEPEKGPAKLPEKPIYLYGVVLLGDKKQALISNPEFGADPAQKQPKDKWVKIGDTAGNFRVAEIDQDRVILTEGDNRREILLYDAKKPARKVVEQKPAAPTVVATGAPAPAPVAAPAMNPAMGAPVRTTPSAPKPAAAAAAGKGEDAGEFTVVNTPFGPVKRRIK